LDFVALLLEHHIHAAVIGVLLSFWEGTSLPHVAVYDPKCFVMWSSANLLFLPAFHHNRPLFPLQKAYPKFMSG
jgi:hypothetical protein